MKQKLLLVLSFMLVTLGLQAETVSITFSEQGYENAQEVTECKIGNDVVVTFSKGGNSSTTPKYYNTGKAFRLYAKNTMTITVPSNATINSVVMTTGSGSYVVNPGSTVTPGTLAIDGTTATISDIKANSVTFTQGGSSGHVRILTLTVNYTTDENAVVLPAKPTLTSSCKFLEEQVVEISCSTDGAAIYYTTDGTDPTENDELKYTESFTVTETTTVKAIAVNENGSSEVATATYTKVELMSIAEAKAAYDAASADTKVFIDLAGAVVTVNKGQYLFIQNETTGINIYASGADYEPGTQFTAGVLSGTSTAYNGMHQISSAEFSNVETTTTTVEPIEVTVAELADAAKYAEYEGRYVKLTGVTLAGKTITKGEDTYAAYDRFSLGFATEYAEATTCDIEGIPACYKTTLQIYPVEITKVSQETGVKAIASENAAPVVYDLLGRRVENLTSGIYIVNGKKVVIK